MNDVIDSQPAGSPRRTFLRGAGLAGAGVATAGILGAPAAEASRPRRGGYLWLAGDHHLHSQYSNDAMYRVDDQVQRAIDHGLDWMVITDHGNTAFSSYSVPMVAADVQAARRANAAGNLGVPGHGVERAGRRARHVDARAR